MEYPKLCKDWNRQVVRLKETITNNGGDIFYAGELMIVTHKSKDGQFELTRPRGGLVIREDIESAITPPLGHEKELLKRIK